MANTDVNIKDPILIVGIGSVGGTIARQAGATNCCDSLQIDYEGKTEDLNNTFRISTDGWINPSVAKLRSFAARYESELEEIFKNYDTLIVVSNLAGHGGCALGPLLCKIGKSLGRNVISIVTMPFGFEHDRIFASGVALRRVRENSDSVILIDNDAFLQNDPTSSQQECYALTNRCLIDVVSHIVKSGIESPGLSLATTSRQTDDQPDLALENSISALYPQLSKTGSVKAAVLHVTGSTKIPLGKLRDIVETTRGSFSENGNSQVALATHSLSGESHVHVVASVTESRFDGYDPLSQIFSKENILDWDELESGCSINLPISNLE